jgi:PTH2 family peptidyl-tRNA hydrolase
MCRVQTDKERDGETVSEFRYKQVIVFRSDLKLSKGKAAVQAGHAAFSAAEEARKHHKKWFEEWYSEGQRKIAVKVKNEKEMQKLEMQARELGLPSSLIVDRGLTEIPPGTVTCLGIGPAPAEKVDKITGRLPLL